jgi:hypothetical protein
VALRGWVEPAVAAPGSVATLVISADPTEGYHVYAYADRDPKAVGVGKPTLIVLTDTSGLRYAPPEGSAKPQEKPAEGVSGTIHYYDSPVRWTIPIEIPAAKKPGEYPVRGLIGVHTCNDAIGCDLPQGASFEDLATKLDLRRRRTAKLPRSPSKPRAQRNMTPPWRSRAATRRLRLPQLRLLAQKKNRSNCRPSSPSACSAGSS